MKVTLHDVRPQTLWTGTRLEEWSDLDDWKLRMLIVDGETLTMRRTNFIWLHIWWGGDPESSEYTMGRRC